MAVMREKVKPGFKPTPQIINLNPTVKKFTTGQTINVPLPSKPQAGGPGLKFSPPAVGLTGSFLTGAGVANQNTAAPFIDMSTRGRGTNYNTATDIANEAARMYGSGGYMPPMIDPLASRSRGANYNSGSMVIPPLVQPNILNPSANSGGYGGGYGGRGGGRGGGGGIQNVSYAQPVVSSGIGNDVNVALNWRVG